MTLRLRRGTDAERLAITPAEGELIYTTDQKLIYVGDGATSGGNPVSTFIPSLTTDLNLNNFDIVGTGNIDILGDLTASGNLEVDSVLTSVIKSSDSSAIAVENTAVFQNDILVENSAQISNDLVVIKNFTVDGAISGITSILLKDVPESKASIKSITIGSKHESSGIFIYNNNNDGSSITISNKSNGVLNSSSISWETYGSSESNLFQINDSIGQIKFSTWNGTSFQVSSIILSEVDDIIGNSYRGNIFLGIRNIDGNYNRFNFNGNGTFTAKNILIGDGGNISTPTQKTTDATLEILGTVKLSVLSNEPTPASPGTFAVADGNSTGWDPKGTDLGVPYPCFYDGIVWNPLY
jgi:hypothetical protein